MFKISISNLLDQIDNCILQTASAANADRLRQPKTNFFDPVLIWFITPLFENL